MAKKKRRAPPTKKIKAELFPKGYKAFLGELKERIRTAQLRSSLAVNRELIALYWQIGTGIVDRQKTHRWGNAVLDRLGEDLQKAFPGLSGFSRTNLYRMRAFYLAYRDASEIVPQAVGQFAESGFPEAMAAIPWGHNVVLVEQVKALSERFWYARKVVENGWSRNVLVLWIESGLYERQGKAQTNFSRTLPKPQSDLARETLKDPYKFEFLTLAEEVKEKAVEEGLLAHIRKFLIELGAGFAFVGQQVRLEVGGEDFYVDLLFYHMKLCCYVVIDLKTTAFKPEYAGQDEFLFVGDRRPSSPS